MTWLNAYTNKSTSVRGIFHDEKRLQRFIREFATGIEREEIQEILHPVSVFKTYLAIPQPPQTLFRGWKQDIFLRDAFFHFEEHERETLLIHYAFEVARIGRRGLPGVPLKHLCEFTPRARNVLIEVEALRKFLKSAKARRIEYYRHVPLARQGFEMRYGELDKVARTNVDKAFIRGYKNLFENGRLTL